MSEPASPKTEATMLRTTPLHQAHQELGARMVDFAGWEMPVWYQGALEEHHAVRSAAGLFDLSHMAELFVVGPQAAEALDWATLVQASTMEIGRARYTMICNDSGGIVDDLIAYRLSQEEFMIVANASNARSVFDALKNRCKGFRVAVEDRTEQFALIAVQGPNAETLVAQVVDPQLVSLPYYRVSTVEVGGSDAHAARTGYTGEDGFELFVPARSGLQLWSRLTESGADGGLVPVGLAARDTLRLEAGMPLYGNELTAEVTPFDVGAARLVKPKTDGFVGSEALLAKADDIHNRLIGLEIAGRRPARTGYAVSVGERHIGKITSGAKSPTLDKLIAIASVEADATSLGVGDIVTVDVRGTDTAATVVELPFYRRD